MYGEIKDPPTDTVYLECMNEGCYVSMDTSVLREDGSFYFRFQKQPPAYFAIRPGDGERVPFIAGNRNVYIEITRHGRERVILIRSTPEPADFFPVEWLVNKLVQDGVH